MELAFSFVFAGILVLLYVTAVFVGALIKKDNSIMDINYGLVFLFVTLILFLSYSASEVLPTVVLALIVLWALRLSIRIYLKNKGKPEDARYRAWRELWQQKGMVYFVLRSYFQIYLLQGTIILIVLSPVLVALTYGSGEATLNVYMGILIWIVGFIWESVADRQLDRFIKNPENKGKIMTEGLFRYSRRPNYFGESLMWWGLWIMVLHLPYGFLAVMSPFAITYIVTRITGPMLEKQFLARFGEQYNSYMKETSYFLPFPKLKK